MTRVLVASSSPVVGKAVEQLANLLWGPGTASVLLDNRVSDPAELADCNCVLFYVGGGGATEGDRQKSPAIEFLKFADSAGDGILPCIRFLADGRASLDPGTSVVAEKCLHLERESRDVAVESNRVDVRQLAAWMCSNRPVSSLPRIKNVFKNTQGLLRLKVNQGTVDASAHGEILGRLLDNDYDLAPDRGQRAAARRRSFHGIKDDADQRRRQIVLDLLAENVEYLKTRSGRDGAEGEKFNILWIENRPEDLEDELRDVLGFFPGYALYCIHTKPGLEAFIAAAGAGSPAIFKDVRGITPPGTISLAIEDVDLLVLDAYLGAGFERVEVSETVAKLLVNHAHVPVIVLSASEDYQLVERCLNNGADYFINKSFAALLPYYIHAIQEGFGHLLSNGFRNRMYRRNLLGNIRYWQHHRDHLWYGDKCYHMIEHAYQHTSDNWKLTNAVLPFVLERCEDIGEDDLYAFCMATWLHDIGHKGNDRHSEALAVRDRHGVISGELILTAPELFKLIESDGSTEEHYKDQQFNTRNGGRSVVEAIWARDDAGLSNAERTALLAIYHKSNGPLIARDIVRMQAEKKDIPVEYCRSGHRDKVIALSAILERRQVADKQTFLTLASLFRLIDGLDIHRTRVGDVSERALKSRVIRQDRDYCFGRLLAIADEIVREGVESKGLAEGELRQRLYDAPRCSILGLQGAPDVDTIGFLLGERRDHYRMVLDYAVFLAVQEGHFDLHECVDDIEVVRSGFGIGAALEVRYTLNKPLNWLVSRDVREARVEPMPLLAKIFGNPKSATLPYPLYELSSGFQHLADALNLGTGIEMTIDVPRETNTDGQWTAKFGLVEDVGGLRHPARARYRRRLSVKGNAIAFESVPN